MTFLLFLLVALVAFALGVAIMNSFWRRRVSQVEHDVTQLKHVIDGQSHAANALRAENARLRVDNQNLRRTFTFGAISKAHELPTPK